VTSSPSWEEEVGEGVLSWVLRGVCTGARGKEGRQEGGESEGGIEERTGGDGNERRGGWTSVQRDRVYQRGTSGSSDGCTDTRRNIPSCDHSSALRVYTNEMDHYNGTQRVSKPTGSTGEM
jgi:hypothetical protein